MQTINVDQTVNEFILSKRHFKSNLVMQRFEDLKLNPSIMDFASFDVLLINTQDLKDNSQLLIPSMRKV
jgi:hypothetical protein